MSFLATKQGDFKSWDFITGNYYKGMCLVSDRYQYLLDMDYKNPIKIALKDPESDAWTKWVEFPGPLWTMTQDYYGREHYSHLSTAYDVHRSILENEIIIESDYPTYEDNYEAARLIGEIIESKGFKPLYYYSGNKSLHVHVYFNWDSLFQLDELMKDQLRVQFNKSATRFKKKFMEWLRTKMISCWDTGIKKFDKDLIRATHLIRAELSRNKQGFKTFLGYSYKDLSFVPYICNENNRIYPRLGDIKLSSPNKIGEIMGEFISDLQLKTKKQKMLKKNRTLGDWGVSNNNGSLRACVKAILGEDFKKLGDGVKRGMFILINELRSCMGDTEAKVIISDWNASMDFPIKDNEIDYRFKTKCYSLSCNYIHNFLEELGVTVPEKCKGKV